MCDIDDRKQRDRFKLLSTLLRVSRLADAKRGPSCVITISDARAEISFAALPRRRTNGAPLAASDSANAVRL